MNEIKTGACINYISIIVRLATQFFLTPFTLSSLGENEYGIFMLSNSVIAWLSLTDFGLGVTVNKYIATYHAKKENDREAHFLGQAMMLFSFLGLLTFAAGMICYVNLGALFPNLSGPELDTLKILYLLTLGNIILAFPLRPLSCVPGSYMKFIVPGLVSLGLSLFNTLLTVLLLVWGYKAIALTVLGVGIGVASLAWGTYYTIRCLGVRIIFRKPDWKLYREMFTFSFWILLNQLMDLFYWRAGTPILARTAGAQAVTLFTLGISFSQYFMTASTAISGVIAPKIMQMVALDSTKEQLTRMMIRVGRLQLALLSVILVSFISCGHDFLHLWVGKTIGDQTGTVWVGAVIVLLPLLVPLTQNTGLAILQALNIHKGEGHHPLLLLPALRHPGLLHLPVLRHHRNVHRHRHFPVHRPGADDQPLLRPHRRSGHEALLPPHLRAPAAALRRHDPGGAGSGCPANAGQLVLLPGLRLLLRPPGRGNHLVLLPQPG